MRARRVGGGYGRALVTLAALVVLTSESSAWAAPGDTSMRVLLVERDRDAFLERVGAEVTSLGFTLVRGAAAGTLEDAARSQHAAAAIRMLPSRKGVEVWMSDATSGRSLLRQVIVDESPGGPDERLIALQTAELLRTSLLARRPPARDSATASAAPATTEPAAAASAPPSASTESPAATDEARAESPATSAQLDDELTAGIQAAVGMLYSPGGASASVQLGLSLQRSLNPDWGLLLDLSLPVRPGTLSGVEGSASVGVYWVGAGVFTRLPFATKPYFATAGVGATFMRVAVEGETRAPLLASSKGVITGGAYVRADVGLEPARWLRIALRGVAAVSAERVTIHFAGNDAGTWGHGIFAGFAVYEIPWR